MEECVVCLEEKEIKIFDCKHGTCTECIKKIRKNCGIVKCPMCREVIIPNETDIDTQTKMCIAILAGNFKIIKQLNDNGYNWNNDTKKFMLFHATPKTILYIESMLQA